MRLVRPVLEHLPSYRSALERGWSPDNVRLLHATREELAAIASDPGLFVERMVDREAAGGPIQMPDGSQVPRLPGYRLWIWDGEFCGSIGLRWQPGTSALPEHVSGHIGYAVVPWKQRLGYATKALGLMLAHAREEGLDTVEITADEVNDASRKVIVRNGGVEVGRFDKPASLGGAASVRYRITL
jgi:predicted acetyltransferase